MDKYDTLGRRQNRSKLIQHNRLMAMSRRASMVAPTPVDGARWIPLTRGLWAMVDEADYPLASEHVWGITKTTPYPSKEVKTNGKRSKLFLHRLLMSPPPGKFVDHIDGNKLDCRRSNMRICTKSDNCRNRRVSWWYGKTSRFKGVCWNRRDGKWMAYIYVNWKMIRLGSFENEIDAAQHYDEAAREYFGEFAYPNFK